jgi:hypothetical protein
VEPPLQNSRGDGPLGVVMIEESWRSGDCWGKPAVDEIHFVGPEENVGQ